MDFWRTLVSGCECANLNTIASAAFAACPPKPSPATPNRAAMPTAVTPRRVIRFMRASFNFPGSYSLSPNDSDVAFHI